MQEVRECDWRICSKIATLQEQLSAFADAGGCAEVFEIDGMLWCLYRPYPRHSQRIYQPD